MDGLKIVMENGFVLGVLKICWRKRIEMNKPDMSEVKKKIIGKYLLDMQQLELGIVYEERKLIIMKADLAGLKKTVEEKKNDIK